MRWVSLLICSFIIIVLGSTSAWGNPSMLPQHPGYQMHDAKDPVTGQSVANDTGQVPLPYEKAVEEAAVYHDKEVVQNTHDYSSLESQGAGVLPKTRGYPTYEITPLVEAIDPNK